MYDCSYVSGFFSAPDVHCEVMIFRYVSNGGLRKTWINLHSLSEVFKDGRVYMLLLGREKTRSHGTVVYLRIIQMVLQREKDTIASLQKDIRRLNAMKMDGHN